MKYALNTSRETENKVSMWENIRKLTPLMAPEKKKLGLAFFAMLINSVLNLLGPMLLGVAIDQYIRTGNYSGAVMIAGILFVIFLGALVAGYLQTNTMGGVGQRTLFRLRNDLFLKLQELPIAFFNQNKAGDLISRINNDTEKLNQFFSQSLVQFFGNIFIMTGAAIFLVCLNWELGLAALAPAVVILIITKLLSPWVKNANTKSLRSTGALSGEVQESLGNFKVILAFNRRDYFRKRFAEANDANFKASIGAGIANQVFTPIYGLAYQIAQIIVLAFGIYLMSTGAITVGLLISFMAFINRFYEPLRFLAALWASFQTALAAWDRVAAILAMDSDMPVSPSDAKEDAQHVLAFEDVAFSYEDDKEILHDINFTLDRGKTYALVGPTGGGKTTTASLMARLYDPTKGTIRLSGKDIRSYTEEQRTAKIGFILQDPFLFTGTVRDNILYGNDALQHLTPEQLTEKLKAAHLEDLVKKFPEGLETSIAQSGDTMSLGQKQLIAFIRAVLREPDLLILDEATANVDTVTEQLLEDILKNLPEKTTKVIIAHRLNTIENADEIFFVNGGTLILAHSMQEAVDMLLHGKRAS